jgi:hypothetical protein
MTGDKAALMLTAFSAILEFSRAGQITFAYPAYPGDVTQTNRAH